VSVWRLEQIHKSWRVGRWPRRAERVGLAGADLQIDAGERVGIVGASGSGKTTLVRCGLGLCRPTSGTVRLFGEDTAAWGRRAWRRARRDAQLLFQDPRAMLHAGLPIGALLRDSAALHRPGEDPMALAHEALDSVGLAGRSASLPGELSGGEQRRVGLARVLLARPRLLVVDEPTAGLDAAIKPRMLRLMLDRVGPEAGIVWVSHDLAAVARYCDRVVVLHAGTVVERFPTASLATGWQPQNAHTARLLHAVGWETTP